MKEMGGNDYVDSDDRAEKQIDCDTSQWYEFSTKDGSAYKLQVVEAAPQKRYALCAIWCVCRHYRRY